MKNSASILFAALFAVAFGSCTKHPVQPRLGEVVIDTLLRNGTLECEVDCRFVSILNADDSPVLEAIERANIGYFFDLEDPEISAGAAADSLLREIGQDYLPDDLPGPRTLRFSAESRIDVADTLLTFVVDRYNYMGGAHGIYGTFCHTYSLETGHEYAAADLFDAEQLIRLEQLIRENLYEQYDAADDEGLEPAGFFPDEIAVTDNFLLSKEGITFFYNPYEIGCYALGGVEVTIPREALEQL